MNRKPIVIALALVAIVAAIPGAYLTGATGDVHPLLLVGIGAGTLTIAFDDESCVCCSSGCNTDGTGEPAGDRA